VTFASTSTACCARSARRSTRSRPARWSARPPPQTEGDALTAALMCAATDLLGETQFTEMYAMDFARDAILMSHMGEGNWTMARPDRPVRLIKRPLGIAGLADPPTFLSH
jgi:L-arabinose isomerase